MTFFSAIYSDTDHIIRSAKRRFATFLKASEPKTDPHAVFLRQPESHTPTHGPLSGAELLPSGSSDAVLHF